MKKTVLGIFAGALLVFFMSSCGEKLLTEEQVQAEITKRVDEGKPAIEAEEQAICDEEFEARVGEEVEKMKAAAEQPAN